MKEQAARELAFAIICDFEELLAEHDIMIPSADREGREEEACIYGTEYYLLEDAITDILVKGSRRAHGMPQTCRLADEIMREFERMLDYHKIRLPSRDPQRAASHVALCTPERDALKNGIVDLLRRKSIGAGERQPL